jgi:ATP-dependent RNA helicase DDX31/DBP7
LMSIEPKFTRKDGVVGLILCPSHELCTQINDVLQKLLRACVWVVAGTIMGGESHKSEKARIRKGLNIIVATPGRLWNHIETTQNLDLSQLMWLILDEADRLLEMGNESALKDILRYLHRKSHVQPELVQTVLVSASLPKKMTDLAEMSMHNPSFAGFRAEYLDSNVEENDGMETDEEEEEENGEKKKTRKSKKEEDLSRFEDDEEDDLISELNEKDKRKSLGVEDFSSGDEMDDDDNDDNEEEQEEGKHGKEDGKEAKKKKRSKGVVEMDSTEDRLRELSLPKSLQQHVVCVEDDRRKLVTLIAFLRETNEKIMIFLGSKAATEFYAKLFRQLSLDGERSKSKLLHHSIHMLHGDMPPADRKKEFDDFSKKQEDDPSILLCTDIASRGLDFRGVRWIVQFDPPGEPLEYLHRVGRTARLGKRGSSLLFLMEHEMAYVELLRMMNVELKQMEEREIRGWLLKDIRRIDIEDVSSYLQSCIEDTVDEDGTCKELGKEAYRRFVRSYATQSRLTGHIFHIRSLHLGHLTSNFGLRDKPSVILRDRSASVMPKDGDAHAKLGVKDHHHQHDDHHTSGSHPSSTGNPSRTGSGMDPPKRRGDLERKDRTGVRKMMTGFGNTMDEFGTGVVLKKRKTIE